MNGLDRDHMHIHSYSLEVLYHLNCANCNNWWSYAHTPDLSYTSNHDPRSFMRDRTMYCPHCGADGVFDEKEKK